MIRKIALLAVMTAAVASPALASTASIRVSLVGKDRAAIEADVTAAAVSVCNKVHQGASLKEMRQCIAQSRTDALSKVARAAAGNQMASL